MSKAAKKKRSLERRAEKAKRKAAERAKYEARVGLASNKKRGGGDGGSTGPQWSTCHASPSCGNPGCSRCFPNLVRRDGRGA